MLQDVKHRLSSNDNYNDFNNEFKTTLNNHVPLKPTPIDGYTKPHTNKILKKIIKISKLKSKASKTGKAEDKKTI